VNIQLLAMPMAKEGDEAGDIAFFDKKREERILLGCDLHIHVEMVNHQPISRVQTFNFQPMGSESLTSQHRMMPSASLIEL
jgi:hypothetical protein